jgi:hypothetical protein
LLDLGELLEWSLLLQVQIECRDSIAGAVARACPRSTRRAALHLIKKREALMTPPAVAAGGD